MLRQLIKRFLPRRVANFRHFFYAWWGAVKYRHPSREMLVIGVTGTSGKSSTIFFLRQLLEQAGYIVGSLSTIDFYIAGDNRLNDQKMTMLGKTQIQKYLREMADKGCQVAIVETTSEGRVQHRHRFIAYDIMVLTNLYPEHIESHGSFAKYKQAKLDIFRHASTYYLSRKVAERVGFPALAKDCCSELKKIALVNGDSEYAGEFLQTPMFDERYTFGQSETPPGAAVAGSFVARSASSDRDGLHFVVEQYRLEPELYGEHNVMNILAAIGVARLLGADWPAIQKGVHALKNAPGRNELIAEAEELGFKVIVDYAFEPQAMAALYRVAELLQPARVIHVFGSTGGGRDVARRFTVGELAGKKADICIVTDEDPYDDDPQKIIADVASAVASAGKRDGVDLFRILDRRLAIQKAIALADRGDLVLVTGKGSEQAMCVGAGKKIPWDDRQAVREAIRERAAAANGGQPAQK